MYGCRFLDLGVQPNANRFLNVDEFASEKFYHLEAYVCPECYQVQIGECPSKEEVFNDNYPFFTSTSQYMRRHFENLANEIKDCYFDIEDDIIIEIGSNDGTFLDHFWDCLHLGVEPSRSVSDMAVEKGLEIFNDYFSEETAKEVLEYFDGRKANIIVTANVLPHMINRVSVLRGIKKLLAPGGIWINEEVSLDSTLYKVAYDQFYNEHIFFSSLLSFDKLSDMFGFTLLDLTKHIPTHGGSTRYYLTHENNETDFSPIHHERILDEDLKEMKVYEDFQERVEISSHTLKDKLYQLSLNNRSAVGYAAAAKSTTILNYCQIGPDLIPCIYDTSGSKIGKYSPGMHIPIVNHNKFSSDNPKDAVLFAWNHYEEIREKEKHLNVNWIPSNHFSLLK